MKKLISIFLCALTIFSCITLSVSAATSGGSGTTKIYVTTKANYFYPGASSITLKQDKQTVTYKHLTKNKTKTKKGYYARYDIDVYNVTKGKNEKSITWKKDKTQKISLKPNCEYVITVRYDKHASEIYAPQAPAGYYKCDVTLPNWWVSSTHKVPYCQ